MRIIRLLLSILFLTITQSGCLSDSAALRWPHPDVARPYHINLQQDPLESCYLRATQLHKAGDSNCVDAYFGCLKLVAGKHCCDRESEIQRSALINLLHTAQDHDRYWPGIGIQLNDGSVLPLDVIGFDWEASDFHQLIAVGNYRNPRLPKHYATKGLGVPLVVQRDAQSLGSQYGDHLTFAATALFVPFAETGSSHEAKIILVNPLTVDQMPSVDAHAQSAAIANDLTAPFAYKIRDRDRFAALNFIYPQRAAARPHLFMAQPYQPGKTPVVLVHGLAADHTTWTELANYLNSCPEFRARFQLWYYQYPTGIPFLDSAAQLRQQLETLCQQLDPTMSDPALFDIRLVGHSMGGLISKLQVTDSCNEIWQEVCRIPIEQLQTTQRVKDRLASWFRFNASQRISQTVLVATPHRGSPIADSVVGKFSAKLVNEPETMEEKLEQLINDNPGVFYDELRKGYPTSIDLLETGDQVLKGIRALRYKNNLSVDSVIGTGKRMIGHGPADGVVPVASAVELSGTSEAYLDATHTSILSDPQLHQLVWKLIGDR